MQETRCQITNGFFRRNRRPNFKWGTIHTERPLTAVKDQEQQKDDVINILSKELNKDQVQLINKGLNFVPT